jgi:hypothetical protein
MSFARAGKADVNERKYPFIVKVPAAASGLNVELNSQIVGFHKSHHTPPRYSLAERSTKQLALNLCRPKHGGSR